MITASELLLLTNESKVKIDLYIKKIEQDLIEQANAGKREYIVRESDLSSTISRYESPKPTVLISKVMEELKKFGYSVKYDKVGDSYNPASCGLGAISDDIPDNGYNNITNTKIVIQW